MADKAGRPEDRQQLLVDMSYPELLAWYAYYEEIDFGHRVSWLQTATIAHRIYSDAPNFSKQTRPRRKIKDFMPKKQSGASNPLDILKMLEGATRQAGGKDLRSEAKKQAAYEQLANV